MDSASFHLSNACCRLRFALMVVEKRGFEVPVFRVQPMEWIAFPWNGFHFHGPWNGFHHENHSYCKMHFVEAIIMRIY